MRLKNLSIVCLISLGLASCGGELTSPDDPNRYDVTDLIGDWELVSPAEPDDAAAAAPACALSRGGLLYVSEEAEVMIGIIEMMTCGDAVQRQVYNGRALLEPDEEGGFILWQHEGSSATQGSCALEDGLLLCEIPSPFEAGRVLEMRWVRAD